MTQRSQTTIPGPKGHWLYGNLKPLAANPLAYMNEVCTQFPGIARIRLLHKTLYLVSDPEYARQILRGHGEHFIKGRHYKNLALLGGQGLITSEGELWRRQRRIAQPLFYKERLTHFAETFAACTAEMLDDWEQRRTQGPVDTSAEFNTLALRIVSKTLLSVDLGAEADLIRDVIKYSLKFIMKRNNSAMPWPLWMPTGKNRQFLKYKKELDRILYKIIQDRYDTPNSHNDLLGMLLEARDAETGERMSPEQIHDEVTTLFAAGFETTAVALTWTWYLLSQHPEAEQKLQEEADAVLQGQAPTLEDLPRLTYLTQVLNESMRLYPPIYSLPRTNLKEARFGDFKLQPGATIMVLVYALHRWPAAWEDPEAFRPERFGTTSADKLNLDAYLPFAGGQRKCIGAAFAMMEMQIICAMLAQRFKLRLAPGHRVVPSPAITLLPRYGMLMNILPR